MLLDTRIMQVRRVEVRTVLLHLNVYSVYLIAQSVFVFHLFKTGSYGLGIRKRDRESWYEHGIPS